MVTVQVNWRKSPKISVSTQEIPTEILRLAQFEISEGLSGRRPAHNPEDMKERLQPLFAGLSGRKGDAS